MQEKIAGSKGLSPFRPAESDATSACNSPGVRSPMRRTPTVTQSFRRNNKFGSFWGGVSKNVTEKIIDENEIKVNLLEAKFKMFQIPAVNNDFKMSDVVDQVQKKSKQEVKSYLNRFGGAGKVI